MSTFKTNLSLQQVDLKIPRRHLIIIGWQEHHYQNVKNNNINKCLHECILVIKIQKAKQRVKSHFCGTELSESNTFRTWCRLSWAKPSTHLLLKTQFKFSFLKVQSFPLRHTDFPNQRTLRTASTCVLSGYVWLNLLPGNLCHTFHFGG